MLRDWPWLNVCPSVVQPVGEGGTCHVSAPPAVDRADVVQDKSSTGGMSSLAGKSPSPPKAARSKSSLSLSSRLSSRSSLQSSSRDGTNKQAQVRYSDARNPMSALMARQITSGEKACWHMTLKRGEGIPVMCTQWRTGTAWRRRRLCNGHAGTASAELGSADTSGCRAPGTSR